MSVAKEQAPLFPFYRPHADDPPLQYAYLRKNEPVSRVRLWDGSTPWLVVRHQDVKAVLAEGDGCGRWSKDRARPGFPTLAKPLGGGYEPSFVYMDEPERGKYRRIVDELFGEGNVRRKFPSVIENTVESLLDSLIQHGGIEPVDFCRAVAMRLPVLVIYTILGVSAQDLEFLTECHISQLTADSTADEKLNANRKLVNHIREMLDQRMAKPGNDIISDLVLKKIYPGHIDGDEALQILQPMLVTATVTNLICYGLILLARHPQQAEQLKADPSLSGAFVEELCRFHTGSTQASPRVAMADQCLGGKLIKAGEGILLSTQSANCDDETFFQASKFEIKKSPNLESSLAFGYGPRRCPVEWLARRQLVTTFERLFQRLPELELAISLDKIDWLSSDGVVGVSELPVVFGNSKRVQSWQRC